MYLTYLDDWQAVGRVHGEIFAHIRPAATMVVIAQLLNPKWRVEIELDAVIEPAATSSAEGR
jgi:enamine deaminase RidA (YjgF/YER057c/UK114 family)